MNKLIVIAFTQAFNNRTITALDKLVAVNEIELIHYIEVWMKSNNTLMT
jgi:hypothetical protein